MHSHTYSGEEVLQGFQCEVKVYSLNDLNFPEKRYLQRHSAKWKAKARCLGRKVTHNRIFLILRPANMRQTLGPRRPKMKLPSSCDGTVPDIEDLLAFPPLVQDFPVERFSQPVLTIWTLSRENPWSWQARSGPEAPDDVKLPGQMRLNVPSSMAKFIPLEAQNALTETLRKSLKGVRSVRVQERLMVCGFTALICKGLICVFFDL